MKNILVVIVTLLISFNAYSQKDSLNYKTNADSLPNSDEDFKIKRDPNGSMHNQDNNPNKKNDFQMQDDMQNKDKLHESKMIQHQYNLRDSSKTRTVKYKNYKTTIKHQKTTQSKYSTIKSASPSKNTVPKKNKTDKNKMYLVPDNTYKKNIK